MFWEGVSSLWKGLMYQNQGWFPLVTCKFTTKFTWASRLRSAEWCGLWKLVTDRNWPWHPPCSVPQNVFEGASGTLPSFFPLKWIALFSYLSCHLKLHKPLFLQKSTCSMPGLSPLTLGCVPHVNSFRWFVAWNDMRCFCKKGINVQSVALMLGWISLYLLNTCLLGCEHCLKESQISWAFRHQSLQSLSYVWLFSTPWTAACQDSLSITNSQGLLKLISIESVMSSNHLIFCLPLLLPSVFPSIRVFSNE